jgi:hypothetical protein
MFQTCLLSLLVGYKEFLDSRQQLDILLLRSNHMLAEWPLEWETLSKLEALRWNPSTAKKEKK